MAEPILDPTYWSQRLKDAPTATPWQAIWLAGEEQWRGAEAEHALLLNRLLPPDASVLDVGCGYGRLLDLVPAGWAGVYLGLDLCPEFVARARADHPGHRFEVCDVLAVPVLPPPPAGGPWDVAVLLSFESMIKKHLGPAAWPPLRGKIGKAARAVLTLDFTRGWKYESYRDEFEGDQ